MDRIFDKTYIDEVFDELKRILIESQGYMETLQGTADKVSEAWDMVPFDVKLQPVSTMTRDINLIKTGVDNIDVDALLRKIENYRTRATSGIPEADKNYAEQIETLETSVKQVKEALERIRGFIRTVPLDKSNAEFETLLAVQKTVWEKVLEDTSKAVEELLTTVKGHETKSMEYSGDPVNLSTGNFIYDKTDLKIEGGDSFVFRRFYNAINQRSGVLGKDWNHNYEVYLEKKKKKCIVVLEEGKEEHFLEVSEGRYEAIYHTNAKLKGTEEGYIYQTKEKREYQFDNRGELQKIELPTQENIIFTYEEKQEENQKRKQLREVKKESGERFELFYDESGYLKEVKDHAGRSVKYEVKEELLRSITTPKGNTFCYGYGLNGKIESVENAQGITIVENEYDEKRRITSQKFPDGGSMGYEYQDEERAVILTERNGSKVTYVHDDKFRDIKHIYPDGEERFEYNKLNKKTLVVDKLGNKTKYGYDESGNLTRVINALGEKTHLSYGEHNYPTYVEVEGEVKVQNRYDEEGNLLESKDGLGNTYAFTYQKKRRPDKAIQPDGSVLEFAYDERGNVKSVTDAFGGITQYSYNEQNLVSQIIDALGNETGYKYDLEGNVEEVRNAKGEVRQYTYNESNKVTEIIDFDGSKIKQEYNVLNKPEKIIDQAGRETRLSYDVMWNLARITEPNGAKTTFIYNEYNRLGRVRNGNGDVTRYKYDKVGNRTEIEDTEGNKTRFAYDALNRLVKATKEDGAETRYEYDNQGRVTKVTNAMGSVVSLEYNANGKMVKETGAMGESRSYTYTSLGKVERIVDERGLTTIYEYERGGRLKGIIYPDGQVEAYEYDKASNLVKYTNRNGYIQTYKYDELGQVTQIEGADGGRKVYTYDAKGNVTSFIDEKGNKTTYIYSITGALIGVIDALGNETGYVYDECDRLIEVRQGEKSEAQGIDEDLSYIREQNKSNTNALSVTRYERDMLGNVTGVIDAVGNKEVYQYDKKSQLIKKVDKDGYLTTYAYHPTGDIAKIQYADGKEVRLSYNALRQLEEMEDWLGITRIQMDKRGRATKVSYPDGKGVSYGYGIAGEREKIVYPDGKEVLYGYDELYRLSSVTDEVGRTEYTYNEKGHLKKKQYSNGIESLYDYTEKGELASLTHQDKTGILDAYNYTYDIQGNKIGIEKIRRGLEEESGSYRYGYDELQRLTEVTKDGGLLRSYGYDAFGNRIQSIEVGKTRSSYAYNVMNQLISRVDMGVEGEQLNGNPTIGNIINEETYSYDKRGNLTEIFKNNNLINQYHFGALNRLEKAVNNQTVEASIYQYNGLGHRVGKSSGNPVEVSLPTDKLQDLTINLTKKIEDTIDLTKQYHNLLQRTEDNSATTLYTWDSSVLGAIGTNNGNHNYLQDELGSPLRLVDEKGEEKEIYGYDEFGCDIYENQGELQPFGYTGYQKDYVTESYYAQAREYQVKTGRFMSEDMIRGNVIVPKTLNAYNYCWNQPINLVDLNGRFPMRSIYPIGTGHYIANIMIGQQGMGTLVVWGVDELTKIELSGEEKDLVKENPIEASIVFLCQREADRWTERVFSEYYIAHSPEEFWKDGDAANAYRHALWNALMARRMGEEAAKKWADAHEQFSDEMWDVRDTNDITNREHTEMDLHNNQIGRNIGVKDLRGTQDISDEILAALARGEMYILIDEEWYDEVIDCE